jgi:hypothetical protein
MDCWIVSMGSSVMGRLSDDACHEERKKGC